MLNPPQAKAVRSLHKPLLVLAGAGCGKTRVIIEKMIHIINTKYCDPDQLYAITFTNKAAKEMQQRISKRLPNSEQIRISTFHALGLQILKSETKYTGLRSGFSILDPSESTKIIQELVPRGIKKHLIAELQWQISSWKNAGLRPAQVNTNVPLNRDIYQQYLNYMRHINAVDFDDLIAMSLWLLEDNDEVQTRWQQKIAYLLVDEYQDTNACQYQLLKRLTGCNPHITCVGDDDQSIYGWRGAQPENLGLLAVDFDNLQVIKLEQNYRSTETILKAANAVVQHNPHSFEKSIWSDLGNGELIELSHYDSIEDEAEQIAVAIDFRIQQKHAHYTDFALLYRSNQQAKYIEQAFRKRNIPYHISGGRSFFDYAEIKDLMAYLRLLVNPRDNSAFLRVINTPKRGIGMHTIKRISQLSKLRNLSFFQACSQNDLSSHIDPVIATKIHHFSEMINALSCSRSPAEHIVNQLLTQTDYINWVQHSANNQLAKINKTKLITDFVKWISAICNSQPTRLDDLINYLSLQTSQDEDQQQGVALMTLHAAKGLEFKQVYLIGVEEGILPHSNSMDEADNPQQALEEERRLMYVGMTRAKHKLHISYVKRRKRKHPSQEKIATGPSRFLKEIPAEFVLTANSPEHKQKTKQNFAALRAELNQSP